MKHYKCTDCGAVFFEKINYCTECCNNEFKTVQRIKTAPDKNVYEDTEEDAGK